MKIFDDCTYLKSFTASSFVSRKGLVAKENTIDEIIKNY
jgi:hypothetical protein